MRAQSTGGEGRRGEIKGQDHLLVLAAEATSPIWGAGPVSPFEPLVSPREEPTRTKVPMLTLVVSSGKRFEVLDPEHLTQASHCSGSEPRALAWSWAWRGHRSVGLVMAPSV